MKDAYQNAEQSIKKQVKLVKYEGKNGELLCINSSTIWGVSKLGLVVTQGQDYHIIT